MKKSKTRFVGSYKECRKVPKYDYDVKIIEEDHNTNQ